MANYDDTDEGSGGEEEFSSLNRSLEVTRSPSQDDLLPELECPVCFDLPLPPIRTCVRGHIICADCCCKLDRCPLCLQNIDVGRNFFAENFLNKSFIKCRFRADGCTKEIKGELMRNHMQNCEFRPLKCKLCSDRILFSDFDNHMLTEHRIGRWDISEDGVKIVSSYKSRSKIRRRNSPLVAPTISTDDMQGVHVPLLVIISCLSIMTLMMVILDYYYSTSDIDEDLGFTTPIAGKRGADLFEVFFSYVSQTLKEKSETPKDSSEWYNIWSMFSNLQLSKIPGKLFYRPV